jgi:DNA polymerase-3 subunit gamma/tau
MSYQAIYRRFRPQSFADLVGQPGTVRILQNALDQGRLTHAYLFCGPRGTGKTSAAKILAKAVNCEQGPAREPCNQCPACLGIQAGRVMDVLEIDAASNRGIDEIRDLREKVRYAATEVRRKVYIIDEVHMLTPEAFNALLKTLEEPPAQVLFILATTEPHKLPATIISRCQRLDFRLIGLQEIADRLREVAAVTEKTATEEALHLIAEEAAGGLRDALSLFEQVAVFSEGEVTADDVLTVLGSVSRDVFYDLTTALQQDDLQAALLLLKDVVHSGRDLHHFTHQAIAYYRDLMVALACEGDSSILGIAPEWALRLRQQAQVLGVGTIGGILAELHRLLTQIRWSQRPRLLWELALIRIFAGDTATENTQLVEKIERLERRLACLEQGGTHAVAPKPAPVSTPLPTPKMISRETAPASTKAYKSPAPDAADPLPVLSREWPRILEQIKKESRGAHGFLLDGRPVSCDEKILQLEFATDFSREMMEAPENRQCLEKIVSEMLGREISVRCRQNGALPQAKSANSREELADSAVDIFRGRIVEG